VRKVRSALGDATDIPRFIETVPGRGYRFIAPVVAATEPELPEPSPMPSARPRLRPRRDAVLLSLLLTVGAGILVWGARGFAPNELLDRGGGTAALRQVCSAAPLSNLDAGTLALPPGASAGDEINIASASINPDAVESYLRGERFLASPTEAATENAIQAYNRATIVDDRYARPYLGLGEALLRSALGAQQRRTLLADDAAEIARMPAPLLDDIRQAFSAALRRHATLGEAWIGLARTNPDPAEAEAQYRKGLELAPDYGMGYVHYAGFLFCERRIDQAISTVGCGLRLAPGTPEHSIAGGEFSMAVQRRYCGSRAVHRTRDRGGSRLG
jgi:tetratricopeptide (TPR) repeat protein